jgi:hypothetical protein
MAFWVMTPYIFVDGYQSFERNLSIGPEDGSCMFLATFITT